jgi:hypothetical protein
MVEKASALPWARVDSICCVSRTSAILGRTGSSLDIQLHRPGKLQYRSRSWSYIWIQAALHRPAVWLDWDHDADPLCQIGHCDGQRRGARSYSKRKADLLKCRHRRTLQTILTLSRAPPHVLEMGSPVPSLLHC